METERGYRKFNTQATALSSAIVMGILYVICALFTLLSPRFALQLFGWIFHLVNLDQIAGGLTITPVGLVIGLVQIVVYTYLTVLLVAWLYNRLSK